MLPINAVESMGMIVANLDRSIDFYTTILSFQKVSDRQVSGGEIDKLYGLSDVQLRIAQLQLGEQLLELTEFITPKGRVIPVDSRSNDRWFQHIAIVVREMEPAYQHLQDHRVSQISPSPQTLPAWNPVAGGIQAFYFKDPDGHNLELIYFPAGKGDPKWHNSTAPVFLGIDHTAIVVANTAISRAFYCDLLGMKLHQESENYGSEQEQLSGISNAKVKISSLKTTAGLGIELLEYLEPTSGRSIPSDSRLNDIWSYQTTITIKDSLSSIQQLTIDPDGHIIKVIQ